MMSSTASTHVFPVLFAVGARHAGRAMGLICRPHANHPVVSTSPPEMGKPLTKGNPARCMHDCGIQRPSPSTGAGRLPGTLWHSALAAARPRARPTKDEQTSRGGWNPPTPPLASVCAQSARMQEGTNFGVSPVPLQCLSPAMRPWPIEGVQRPASPQSPHRHSGNGCVWYGCGTTILCNAAPDASRAARLAWPSLADTSPPRVALLKRPFRG